MTLSQKVDHWADWMFERRHGGDAGQLQAFSSSLQKVRDRILYHAQLREGNTLLDVGTGDGLVAMGALGAVGEHGKVIFSDISQDLLNACRHKVQEIGMLNRAQFLLASADDLHELGNATIEIVTTRSVLIFVNDKQKVFQEFYRILVAGGRLSIFEPINQLSHPRHPNLFWGYDVTPVADLGQKLCTLYESLQPAETDPMYNFTERDLFTFAENAGFSELHLDLQVTKTSTAPMNWHTFLKTAGNPLIPTVEEAMQSALTPAETARFCDYLQPLVENGQGTSRQAVVYLWAEK